MGSKRFLVPIAVMKCKQGCNGYAVSLGDRTIIGLCGGPYSVLFESHVPLEYIEQAAKEARRIIKKVSDAKE